MNRQNLSPFTGGASDFKEPAVTEQKRASKGLQERTASCKILRVIWTTVQRSYSSSFVYSLQEKPHAQFPKLW